MAEAEERAQEQISDAPDPMAAQIDNVAALHEKGMRRISRHQRAIERITHHVGQPRTLYTIGMVVLAWCTWNLAENPAHGQFDPPPFFYLQGLIALYAAIVSSLVLITQNRAQRHVEERSYLELQVNLMAEQKTAKLIALLEELRRDMPNVRDRVDREADALATAVDAHAVMDALEGTLAAGVLGTPVPPASHSSPPEIEPTR